MLQRYEYWVEFSLECGPISKCNHGISDGMKCLWIKYLSLAFSLNAISIKTTMEHRTRLSNSSHIASSKKPSKKNL